MSSRRVATTIYRIVPPGNAKRFGRVTDAEVAAGSLRHAGFRRYGDSEITSRRHQDRGHQSHGRESARRESGSADGRSAEGSPKSKSGVSHRNLHTGFQ